MGMDVNRNEPLSPEARRYLLDRNQHELVAQIDAQYPPAEAPEDHSYAAAEGWRAPSGLEELSTEELLEELSRRKDAGDSTLADDADDDYDEWTVAELQSECEKRQLSKSGKKPELVARLRDDDVRRDSEPPL